MEGQDIVYYRMYPQLDDSHRSPAALVSDIKEMLEELKSQSLEFALSVTEGYVWQHEPFNLQVCCSVDDCFSSGSDSRVSLDEREIKSLSSCETFVPHLFGKVKFGDNLEDEWFIVYILLEISRRRPSLSVTVRDSDGEFLLMESAFFIPKWLNPENSHNRIFLRQGAVHFVPLHHGACRSQKSTGAVPLKNSLQLLAEGSFDTKASAEVQNVILSRISGYPGRAQKNVQRIRCTVPLPVAHILKHEPQLIAFAVESFYIRDGLSMKVASRMEKFSPRDEDGNERMVDTVVRMSKTMYAQLAQQAFEAPRGYPMAPDNSPAFKRAAIGMKIAVGFEIMHWERSLPDGTDFAVLRKAENDTFELEEQQLGESRDEPTKDAVWKTYKASLERNNYFRGLQPGCREHRELLQAAISQYRGTNASSCVSFTMDAPAKRIAELLGMPHSVSDFSSVDLDQSDDDMWLYNGEEEGTVFMGERQKELEDHRWKNQKCSPTRKSSAIPGSETSENLEIAVDVLTSVKSFVNNVSSFEGAEVPMKKMNHLSFVSPKFCNSGDKEDSNEEAVNLDMKRLAKELESVFDAKEIIHFYSKRPPDEEFQSSSDLSPDDSSSSEDELDSLAFDIAQPEDSLSSAGTFDETNRTKADDSVGKEYSILLEEELKSSTLLKTFTGKVPATGRAGGKMSSDARKVQEGDAESPASVPYGVEAVVHASTSGDENNLVDVDVNLVESLLQSYTFQQGMPGPASNLLGSMGVKLPDNSD